MPTVARLPARPVALAGELYADAAGVGLPRFPDYIQDNLRIVTSDGAGQFAIEDGAPVGAIVLDVILRSAVAAPLDGELVVVLRGEHEIARMDDLRRLSIKGSLSHFARPVARDGGPRAVFDKLRPGDLLAHIEHAGTGELTVCGFSLVGDWMDPEFQERALAHFSQLSFKCKQIGPDTAVVELLVPPQQRFD